MKQITGTGFRKGIIKIVFLPMLSIVLFTSGFSLHAVSQTWGDYTLYSTQNSSKAYLVDMNGSVYHTWTFVSNKKTGYSSYLLPGGSILRTVQKSGNYFQGGGMTGEVMIADWDGNVTWDFVYSTTQNCCHHDICPMPNGNVLLISYESKTASEVSQAGCSQSITMWPDKIVEVQPSGTSGGTVVWEWHVWDHLCQSLYPAKDNYVTSIVEHPELLNINYKTQKDWMHVNGIDYNEALDQIVFSSHNMNEFYVIDHSTTTEEAAGHTGGNSGKGGDFLYRWGNPVAYQASGTTNFNVVHDAHWVPADCPNANYLGAFNNQGGTGGKSCVDLVNPPYDGYNYSITTGQAFEPPTYTWRHTYSGQPTQNEGSAQNLPNGNTLVCISLSGYIYEIDSNQNVVWSKTIGGSSSNARRYTTCYINMPPTPVITQLDNTLVSSAALGNQWFFNNEMIAGETGQSIIPDSNGSYTVQVTDGSGCISDMSDPFIVSWVGLEDRQITNEVLLYPNPTTGIVYVNSSKVPSENGEVRIFNSLGKMILHEPVPDRIDLSGFTKGLYFYSVKSGGIEISHGKIILIK